jgi:hypothetical protein
MAWSLLNRHHAAKNALIVHTVRKGRIQMPTSRVSSKVLFSGVTRDEKKPSAGQTYRTKTSFVAVHFDQAGKGRIVFLPEGAMLRVIGPSSCLREACEVGFENQLYNVFEIDLVARSILICEPIRTKSRAIAVCA